MDTYVTAAGETRTTCGAHRTQGYYIDFTDSADVVQRCRGCDRPAEVHETSEETVARNRAA